MLLSAQCLYLFHTQCFYEILKPTKSNHQSPIQCVLLMDILGELNYFNHHQTFLKIVLFSSWISNYILYNGIQVQTKHSKKPHQKIETYSLWSLLLGGGHPIYSILSKNHAFLFEFRVPYCPAKQLKKRSTSTGTAFFSFSVRVPTWSLVLSCIRKKKSCIPVYPLEKLHSNGISPFSIGNASSKGPFLEDVFAFGKAYFQRLC